MRIRIIRFVSIHPQKKNIYKLIIIIVRRSVVIGVRVLGNGIRTADGQLYLSVFLLLAQSRFADFSDNEKKQYYMMKLVTEFYDESLDALGKGADIEDIVKLPVRESIGRFKYIHEDNIDDEYAAVSAALKKQLKNAVDSKEEF